MLRIIWACYDRGSMGILRRIYNTDITLVMENQIETIMDPGMETGSVQIYGLDSLHDYGIRCLK